MAFHVNEGDLVLVDWKDSGGHGEWKSKEEAHFDAGKPVCVCTTVGWVLRMTEETLTLHGSRSSYLGQENVSDVITIPNGCILRATQLGWERDKQTVEMCDSRPAGRYPGWRSDEAVALRKTIGTVEQAISGLYAVLMGRERDA